jgi:hypothetical protein
MRDGARGDTEAARAEGASPVITGARARLDGEAGTRERDGGRFRPRINPRGQVTVRSLRISARLTISLFSSAVFSSAVVHAAGACDVTGSAARRSRRSISLMRLSISGMYLGSSRVAVPT